MSISINRIALKTNGGLVLQLRAYNPRNPAGLSYAAMLSNGGMTVAFMFVGGAVQVQSQTLILDSTEIELAAGEAERAHQFIADTATPASGRTHRIEA